MSAPEATDFDSLRAQAVQFAQAASGNIWTDFNLHDPGVTLLEQTCFALSEIGYQTAHPIRDLLTDADGQLRYFDLALYDPRAVLPSAPVTDLDLTSYLSDQPGVSSAWVTQGARLGLYDVVVIPSEPEAGDVDEDALAAQLATCFAQRRPLATDLGQITIARKRDTVLSGRIDVSPTADPERVAARFYYHVAAILRGRTAPRDRKHGATRDAVYAQPELFFRPRAETGERIPDIDVHLTRLRAIPGIRDIGELSFRKLPVADPEEELKPGYLALVLPQSAEEIELDLRVGENRLRLDHNRIHEEYIRVSAENISRAHHHLAEADWAVLKDGRRRDFTRSHVDDMLPAIYRLYGASARAVQNPATPKAPVDDLFVQYRDAINTQLEGMSQALAQLPALFDAETDQDTDDPAVHARRTKLLDLLLAIQGETLPAIRHSGLHQYRSVAARQRFDLLWRLAYLRALPELNAARGTGPTGPAPGGFMARLGLLADIAVENWAAAPGRMQELGWVLDDQADLPAPGFARRDLLLPLNPFDMIVPRDDLVDPLPGEALPRLTPWVREGAMHPDLFQRAADADAFVISPVSGGRYAVLFDSGDAEMLYEIETTADKAEAMARVNALRASWRGLHEEAECACLVEDVLLRGPDADFAAHSATLVLTGWTARTRRTSYRSYVAELVQQLAPAHVVVTLQWLDMAQMARFRELRRAIEEQGAETDARADLRAFLHEMEGVA
ncbi:hypothetical protein [uncultured Roseobacter sp.]|uniref:hypothetical protein n=1 Tax=uncultured Roseobacter sp. TaxID=114847 RepID=UPI0026068010|nr:hypothetical protein [uncultured Roseobacter sp.]